MEGFINILIAKLTVFNDKRRVDML